MNFLDLHNAYREVIGKHLGRDVALHDEYLIASDFPNQWVQVEGEDGSTCLFKHAFVVEYANDLIVCTEHFGYHIFNFACDEYTVIKGESTP